MAHKGDPAGIAGGADMAGGADVAGDARLPLLFLDVDGPVLPFAAGPAEGPWDRDIMDAQLSARVSPALGRRLRALPCRLVWATAWEEHANTEIGPRIGLPELPVVTWPDFSDEHAREDAWFGLHWKTRTLVDWAAGRNFAWVDDEITEADREWVAEHHTGHALLHRVDPAGGLTDGDIVALDQWLRLNARPIPGTSY